MSGIETPAGIETPVGEETPGGEKPTPAVAAGGRSAARVGPLVLAGSSYLALAVFVFWSVWSNHATSTTTCGCGDSSLFIWFLEWPAYAIQHGLDPLYSSAMSHPAGVNLLSNTSELAIGVVLVPITWIFGPVATFNVALTLAPALSALAMYALLRRWVSWAPAAFFGGLLYGFSPFILVSVTDGHLMNGMAVVPPLVVLCLDELIFREPRRPMATGVLLGLLVALQFFIGTELLLMMIVMGVVGTVLIVAYGVTGHRHELRRRARRASPGLAAAATVAVALLAYPVWFALAGPAHTSGPVWPNLYLGYEAVTLKDYLFATPASATFTTFTHRVGGYQGRTLSGQYFGWGVLAVVLGGATIWRRDRRLWFFGAVAVVSIVLSLGANPHHWLPWQTVASLPVLQNVIPSRFVLLTYLAVAVMVGLIVDHAAGAARRRHRTRGRASATSGSGPGVPSGRGRAAIAAGLLVAAVALAPVAAYLAGSTPVAAQPVVLPTWFRTVAPRLEGHQVLLVFPVPYQLIESAMTWQAVDRMHYAMVGGGGPGGIVARGGPERQGQAIVGAASFSFSAQSFATGDAATVRRALEGWGVTMVVIPDQPDLAPYDRVTSVPFAAGLVTAATGAAPVYQAGAWVWRAVDHAGPAVSPSPDAFSHCTADGTASPDGIAAVSRCVLSSAHSGP